MAHREPTRYLSDDNNKPTSAVTYISAETLEKLASRDEDIRNSGVIDIFVQHLPQIPKGYVFKPRDRKFVEDALHAAFDLTFGVPRLVKYAHENYGDYIKLFARLPPEAQKQETSPAVVQVFHNVPVSALDMTDITDITDMADSDDA